MLIWMDGHPVESSQAMIPVLDPAFLYGESLVTTMAITKGRPEFVERHLTRILSMAHRLGWSHVPSREVIQSGISGILGELTESPRLLRITMTPGSLTDVSLAQEPCRPGSWFLFPVTRKDPDPSSFENGVTVSVASRPLLLPGDPRGNLKTGNLLLSRHLAKRRPSGSMEWLLKGSTGRLLEGSVSNVFFVRDDGVVLTATEEQGVLPGVIRSVVLEELKAAGIGLRWSAPTVSGLNRIREILLTNSYLKVMPVGQLVDEAGGILWRRQDAAWVLGPELREKVERRARQE